MTLPSMSAIQQRIKKIPRSTFFVSLVTVGLIGVVLVERQLIDYGVLQQKILREDASANLQKVQDLENQDQFKINQDLKKEISNIQTTFGRAVTTYEDLVKLREQTKDTAKFDVQFADILVLLSKQNWSTASAELSSLNSGISDAFVKIAATFTIPANVPASNAPPGSGFSQQTVNVDGQSFLVDIVAGDLGSTRVIVDTANSGDCFNNCPVLSLGDYVARNGAFAGVNGSYFCPAEYPSCAGKTNTFDTLLMNKNKVYFNSANNVYSTVPLVVFLSGSIRFLGQSLDWGRDTSPDSLIANRPLLLSGGNIAFSGEGEPKEGNRGGRSFVANKGNTVYIGVVFNATVGESAKVMKALGMDNALNLDDGGSTALWSGGYKVGPGRNLPNAILFIRR